MLSYKSVSICSFACVTLLLSDGFLLIIDLLFLSCPNRIQRRFVVTFKQCFIGGVVTYRMSKNNTNIFLMQQNDNVGFGFSLMKYKPVQYVLYSLLKKVIIIHALYQYQVITELNFARIMNIPLYLRMVYTLDKVGPCTC